MIKLKSYNGLPIPKGVNVYVVSNPPFGGVFFTPQQAYQYGLSKKAAVLLPPDCGVRTFLHEIGHYLHYREKSDFGVNDGVDERKADFLGKLYYFNLTGKRIRLRNVLGEIDPPVKLRRLS